MKCKYCGKVIKNCYNSQKYHPKCFKQNRKKYYQRPEVKQMKRKRDRKTYALKKEFKKKILLKILEKYKK